MSGACPKEDELLELALGDARESDARRLSDHVAACTSCRERLAPWRRLTAELGALRGDVDGEDFGGGVMARVVAEESAEGAPRAGAPARRWRWRPPALTMAFAACALALAVVGPRGTFLGRRGDGAPEEATGTFAARGGQAHGKSEALADVTVLRARRLGPAPERLLRDGDGMALKYGNPSARPFFLMAFALDAAGAVHWLYPAYLDAASDPEALLVAAHTPDRVADEVVQPDHPARGTLRVVTLVFPSSHHVRELESRLAGASSKDSVRSLFPEAKIKEWTFECVGS